MAKVDKRISAEAARKLLVGDGFDVSIEETMFILDFLYELAELAMVQLKRDEQYLDSE